MFRWHSVSVAGVSNMQLRSQLSEETDVKVAEWTNRLSLGILEASKCEISRGYEFSCSLRLSKLLAFQKTFLSFFE